MDDNCEVDGCRDMVLVLVEQMEKLRLLYDLTAQKNATG